MAIVKIDEKQLTWAVDEGGKLVFKKEAEDALLGLLEAKARIDEAISKVKSQIEQSGREVAGDGFRGVIGEKIRAVSRFFGEKYGYVKAQEEELKDAFLSETKYFKVNSKEVEQFVKDTGSLPEGVFLKDRKPQISISVIDKLLPE